ncbi:MAG: pseudouridine synthase [Pseudomonadota bacterium]
MKERLQKVLAKRGVSSRRQAEELMLQGSITVNGKIVRELGTKVDPDVDAILVNGKPLPPPPCFTYIALNKPRGFVTTLRDPQKRPIVVSLLQDVPVRVYPVGRLDMDTEGLLLLTNDGELSWKLQHPRFKVMKIYEAEVKGIPGEKALDQLRTGVFVDERKTLPARLKVLKRREHSTLLEMGIREGRKRQVKKMCAAVGHPVISLRRTAIDDIRLGDLAAGQYRHLRPAELERLKRHLDNQD